MRYLIPIVLFIAQTGMAQTIADCKHRFDKYLNLKGALSDHVQFESNAFYILNEKKEKEFAVYANETKVLADFFENSSLTEQSKLYKLKGVNKLSKKQLDSLVMTMNDDSKLPKSNSSKPLQNIRIAIDPGHFSSNYEDSKVEGKYVKLVNEKSRKKDTITLVEGQLTFLTAQVLKNMLEEQGAKVILSRNKENMTAFNQTYNDWYKYRRNKVLDSLKQKKELNDDKYKILKQFPKEKLFWAFFRDYELLERAKKMNSYYPHLSVIIHYNVDDKNSPWTTASQRNNSMCFISGAFGTKDLAKPANKLHFLRLLLGKQVQQSETISRLTMNSFEKNLKVTKAKQTDTDYLMHNTLSTNCQGVFCRNLILTRYINSPLVYGESLYQDNAKECNMLSVCNYNDYGVKTSERVYLVAKSYYEAIVNYFKEPEIKISGK
ncbi:MAG: N-acetylmuramoyl-L-alanine amidase [Bacteroidia bacterium]|nr:N-acetylmuramoyl-L-alanine amidase [Bacteroidia bacterium]